MLLRGLVRWFCPWFCVGPPWGGSPLYFGRVILSSSNFHQPFEKEVPFSLGAARAPFVLKEFNGSKIYICFLGLVCCGLTFCSITPSELLCLYFPADVAPVLFALVAFDIQHMIG